MLGIDGSSAKPSTKAVIGYRRVSTTDQTLDRQSLEGCEKIFDETESGAKRERPALIKMIEYVREGDEVRIHSIDRLARDLRDLQDIINKINNKGATISFVSERLTFSSTSDDPIAKLQLHMMGAFAEFERSIIKKRQAEGIAKAKAKGVYRGRKSSIDIEKVKQLNAKGQGASVIAKELGIGRASVYRLLGLLGA